ncbi:7534_t:CDS:1, partial [Cetraspora pellucida]
TTPLYLLAQRFSETITLVQVIPQENQKSGGSISRSNLLFI